MTFLCSHGLYYPIMVAMTIPVSLSPSPPPHSLYTSHSSQPICDKSKTDRSIDGKQYSRRICLFLVSYLFFLLTLTLSQFTSNPQQTPRVYVMWQTFTICSLVLSRAQCDYLNIFPFVSVTFHVFVSIYLCFY